MSTCARAAGFCFQTRSRTEGDHAEASLVVYRRSFLEGMSDENAPAIAAADFIQQDGFGGARA